MNTNPTPTPEAFDLEICVDCLALICNGTVGADDIDADNDHDARISANWPTAEGWIIAPGDLDDGHFSWSACEACGSTLGGDRHPATAFRK